MTGIYLYCVTEGEPSGAAAPRGIDENHEVYSLTYGDLAAVVSPVDLAEYGEGVMEERLQSMEWLESKVRIHTQVIVWAMEQCPVLPMKFATIFSAEEKVRGLLSEQYEDFKSLLRHLRGVEEWGAKLYIQPETFFRARLGEELESLEREMAGKPRGQAYLLRKKMEQSLEERRERLLAETIEGAHRRLSGKAEDSCENDVITTPDASERMELNAAYLVSKDRREEFLAETEAIQAELSGFGIRLCPSGPWPPYNFSRPELRREE